MRRTSELGFEDLVDRDVVLDTWGSHSHGTDISIYRLRPPWTIHGYAAVRHDGASGPTSEVILIRNGDVLESVELEDFIRYLRRRAPSCVRRRGVFGRFVVATVAVLALTGCGQSGDESTVAAQDSGGENGSSDTDQTSVDSASTGDAPCPDWVPAALPSGAPAGEPAAADTDFGIGTAWGRDDDRVILIIDEAALSAAGGPQGFDAGDQVEMADGTVANVIAVGDATNENAQVRFTLDGCEHLIFTGLSAADASTWAASL